MKLVRKNNTLLRPAEDTGIPIRIFANREIGIESQAVEELAQLLEIEKTIDAIQTASPEYFGKGEVGVVQAAVTPDFHKGSGIPIGTILKTKGCILPQAIGNDVNCGMRLVATDMDADKVIANLDKLEGSLRRMFFGGRRQIPTVRKQREALLREGLPGLLESTASAPSLDGLWRYYDPRVQAADLERVDGFGKVTSDACQIGAKYLGDEDLRRDSQIGTIGGGNHFVEIQRVKTVFNGAAARAWGIYQDRAVVMVHSGSLMLGHAAGAQFIRALKEVYPPALKHPSNGLYPLSVHNRESAEWKAFWNALAGAANFAFGNRLFLGLMAMATLFEEVGECDYRLVYDAPHNLVWKSDDEADGFLHRKGACPARGAEQLQGTPFAYFGEPVMIPGSMGASSFLMAGLGNADSLFSASHGAGRCLSRGASMSGRDDDLRQFLETFRIVTPIDIKRPDIRLRRDIVRKWEDEIKKEAPWAYKAIGPVIETQEEANIVRRVAELTPIITVKA